MAFEETNTIIELTSFQAAIAILTLIILVIGVLWFLWATLRRWFRGQLHDPRDRQFIRGEWGNIQHLAQANNEASLQLAVMQADKLLDHVLKNMMMPGSTLGERLKVACIKYPELKDVWWAHKVRNSIVHEPGSHSVRKLQQALNEFEKAFKKLGAL